VTTDDAGVVVVDARVCPVRVRHVAASALAAKDSARRAAAGVLVSTERALRVAERTLVSLEDVRRATTHAPVSPADSHGEPDDPVGDPRPDRPSRPFDLRHHQRPRV
jgi:hypothetical protein